MIYPIIAENEQLAYNIIINRTNSLFQFINIKISLSLTLQVYSHKHIAIRTIYNDDNMLHTISFKGNFGTTNAFHSHTYD